MKFNAGEIASVIQKEIEDFRGQLQTSEVGRVVEVGDGIARVYGLSSAMSGEMVEFSSGVRGQVFNLEENSVGVIILGDYLKIRGAPNSRGVPPNPLRTGGREEKTPESPPPVNNYRLYRRNDLEAVLRRVTRLGRVGGKRRQRTGR